MTVGRTGRLGRPDYERFSDDFYPTEPCLVHALLDHVPFDGLIWEPACGDGAICEVLIARGLVTIGSDIVDRGWFPGFYPVDFLTPGEPSTPPARHVITNPPFKLAEAFVRRALELTRQGGGKVAMLLRHEFDAAAGYRPIFAEHPAFAAKLTLHYRPRWAPRTLGQRDHSPRQHFAWYVWDWQHRGAPILKWVDGR